MAERSSNVPQGWIKDATRPAWESGQAWLYLVQREGICEEQRYVCKVLKNVSKPSRLRRFSTEIEVTRTLANLGYPVAPVTATGIAPSGRAYLITPYFPSGDLRKYSQSHSFKGDLARICALLLELYTALHQVHTVAAHRDLKPDNILIDARGSPVLCDFGLCLELWQPSEGTRVTEELEQIGSRHYIAPEALAGLESVNSPIALDAYAFGKIAYEMAADEPLPGVMLPTDKWDLTALLGFTDASYLFNQTVLGLVSHSVDVRMETWRKLPTIFREIGALLSYSPAAVSGDRFALSVSKLLDTNLNARVAKQERDFFKSREEYCARLAVEFARRLTDNDVSKSVVALCESNDKIEFSTAPHSVGPILSLPILVLEQDALRDGQSWPGLSARLRVGAEPADDLLPTLDTDVIWRDNFKSFKVRIAIYLAKYGPAPQGGTVVAIPPQPKLFELDWAKVGDEALIAQAGTLASDAASEYFSMLQGVLEPAPPNLQGDPRAA